MVSSYITIWYCIFDILLLPKWLILFSLRRRFDWKYRKTKWIVFCETEPDPIAWAIAKYFGYPIIREKRPYHHEMYTRSESPPTKLRYIIQMLRLFLHLKGRREINYSYRRFHSLPNKLIHVQTDDDGDTIKIFIYYPRARYDRMAEFKRFELANPACFDEIKKWLDESKIRGPR